MRRTLTMAAAVIVALALLDLAVALLLSQARPGLPLARLAPLATYFEYGRSVPGKIARWKDDPDAPGNLLAVAWIPDIVADSTARFAEAPLGRTVRGYGMSFSNNILEQAAPLRPDLALDLHAGPGAPANFALALFEADRANRAPGDVVVLGVLASAVPALGALTNATWVFEQPAPFTYPIYRADGDVVVPIVRSLDDHLALEADPEAAAAWAAQLAREDVFYGWQAFAMPWLDASPFARLVRRTLAARHLAEVRRAVAAGKAFPVAETILGIVERFERMARADGQVPIVLLIQTRDPRDVDLAALVGPALARRGVTVLATADVVDVRDMRSFVADGHYAPARDAELGRAFAALLPR